MKTPVIIINSKAYKESTLNGDLKLANICREVSEETGVNIIYAPQQVNLAYIAKNVKIPCFAQHVDAIEPGSYTGHVSLLSIKEAGALGTLVNHSEKPMLIKDIDFIVSKAKEMDLETVVCTNNVSVTSSIAALEPTAIAVEPPELIGSGIPVSKAKPEIVEKSVEAVKKISENVIVLCGAGISKGEDVKKAIELGTEGVLLASGVVKAKNPKEVLLDLASGVP